MLISRVGISWDLPSDSAKGQGETPQKCLSIQFNAFFFRINFFTVFTICAIISHRIHGHGIFT